MTELTAACWICLGESPPDAGRYHRACAEALFGTAEPPRVAFNQLEIATWAEEHTGRLSIERSALPNREWKRRYRRMLEKRSRQLSGRV